MNCQKHLVLSVIALLAPLFCDARTFAAPPSESQTHEIENLLWQLDAKIAIPRRSPSTTAKNPLIAQSPLFDDHMLKTVDDQSMNLSGVWLRARFATVRKMYATANVILASGNLESAEPPIDPQLLADIKSLQEKLAAAGDASSATSPSWVRNSKDKPIALPQGFMAAVPEKAKSLMRKGITVDNVTPFREQLVRGLVGRAVEFKGAVEFKKGPIRNVTVDRNDDKNAPPTQAWKVTIGIWYEKSPLDGVLKDLQLNIITGASFFRVADRNYFQFEGGDSERIKTEFVLLCNDATARKWDERSRNLDQPAQPVTLRGSILDVTLRTYGVALVLTQIDGVAPPFIRDDKLRTPLYDPAAASK